MISKAKEVLRKLEFGILEFFVGALMIIGLIGYFGTVPADLDWIDHTVSFILFSYLFYKLDITSILFGKTSKFANLIIVISYFSLFFKDIISYTSLDVFKFKVIKFVDVFYLFFYENLAFTNLITFYIGIVGILFISIYITKKIGISHPSFLYAVHQKEFKNKLIKFVSIFVLLLGFYYFIYNMILEWLEFIIDDPVIAAGVVFFIYRIAKHHEEFHPDNFIFKIGEFSSGWYSRFVSLFHYKKTLPLAISGLLILHAISDLGVFAYSLIFLKENFYLEFLKYEHTPFLSLFLNDAKNIPTFAIVPLFIVYLLGILSLIIFLLIPVIVWIRMFSQKELHFSRIFLFFIYSSAVAYMLLPGYVIKPISELSIKGGIAGEDKSLRGVDIISLSLLENKSILDNLFPNKLTIIIAVSLISILFGLIVYILSANCKIKRELYAISVIGGLTFYAVYIFYFFSSLLNFYGNVLLNVFTRHILIWLTIAIFLVLSLIFYIGGYLIFLYEIVMEYHKRKWSGHIGEELAIEIQKIKRIEKRMVNPRKAQLIGEVFKYGLVGVVSVVVLIVGYKMVDTIKERACKTEIAKFEIDLRDLGKSLRFGAKELQSYNVPCKSDKIYFFDLNKDINPENFKEILLIKDMLESGSNNIFLIKKGEVKRSFYAGNLEMVYPYYMCFVPKFDKVSFFAEGAGKSIKVAGACDQPECTFIPVHMSTEEAKRIIAEMIEFGCVNCPKDLGTELSKATPTRESVEIFRKFTFCEGITNVEILIKPKEGSKLKDFRFYEYIPKTCIDDLNKYLAEDIEGDVEIKGDPLIMWYFSDLGDEKRVSYRLSTILGDECKQAIQGLGVAQFVERKGQEEERKANTAPTIAGLPDVTVSGVKLHKSVVRNLWKYAQDKETGPRNLVYSIIDQTNSDLVECSISNEKHVDCEVKQNKEGTSRVTIQVDDFEFTDMTSFKVDVSQFCKNRERKECAGNQVFWFDSCGNQQELHEVCESDETCEDGECKEECIPNAARKCEDDDKIYWFDSCGEKGSLYYNCKDHPLRKNCKNGKCCIGNLFCQTP